MKFGTLDRRTLVRQPTVRQDFGGGEVGKAKGGKCGLTLYIRVKLVSTHETSLTTVRRSDRQTYRWKVAFLYPCGREFTLISTRIISAGRPMHTTQRMDVTCIPLYTVVGSFLRSCRYTNTRQTIIPPFW